MATCDLTLDARAAQLPVSPTLYGLFLEDINFAADGGLNANVVNNHSFEGVYVRATRAGFVRQLITKRNSERVFDRLRHWQVSGGTLLSSDHGGVVPGAWFARLESAGTATLENWGYPGTRPAIPVRAGVAFGFSALVRRGTFEGGLGVKLRDASGRVLATSQVELAGEGWQRVEATLISETSALTSLSLVFTGHGTVDLDEVRLVAADHWGAGDPRWSQGVLRRDLVEALRDLRPTFMRFPGGCIVEGNGDGNAYDWKRSVGPLEGRRPDYSLWGVLTRNGDYSQSLQVGFYEYFLLCEDLGMIPMPVVNAGLSCQVRTRECLAVDGPDFARLVQDVLDLVDWATGDPATSEWARLRAEAGHPEPFALDHLGIGNENWGPDYLERFELIRAAVEERRPGITVVLATGIAVDEKRFDLAWEHARTHPDRLIVDEHMYASPKKTVERATRYDDRPRTDPKVMVGEWAAHIPAFGPMRRLWPANVFEGALAEAAFLTGVERNADQVVMTCYAPVFNLVEHGQWVHNLIDFSPTAVLRTANYHVQRLFGTTVGDRIVPLAGELPQGVFASSTTTDDRQFVKLVNTAPEPVEVLLRLPAVAAGTAATSTMSAGLKAANRLAFTGRPAETVSPVEGTVDVVDGILRTTLPGHSLVSLVAPRVP